MKVEHERMSKYYGNIGFSTSMEETSPGVWEDKIIVKPYFGDMTKNVRRWQGSDRLNDNLTISNNLEIIADEFMVQNFVNIRYVEFMGVKWTVSDVSFEFPRAVLTLGEVFNER